MQNPEEKQSLYVIRPVAKSSTILLSSQLALMAINIITTAYILRLLEKKEYAAVAVLDILIAVFTFSDLGLLPVALQQAPSQLQSKEQSEIGMALIKCGLVYRIIALVLMSLLTIAFAPFISNLFFKTPQYSWTIVLLVPSAMITVMYFSLQVVAQIKNDFYTYAIWDVVLGILRPVFSIVGFFVYGMPGFLIGILISAVISLIGLGWSLRHLIINRVKPALFWPTFKYGLPFYIRGFTRFGYLQYDQLIVGALLTPDILASYSVVRRITKFLYLITESFQNPITTQMSKLRQDLVNIQASFFRKATRYMTFLVAPLALFLTFTSPWVMKTFAGEKYAEEWPLLVILVIAQACYAIFGVYSNQIFVHMKPGYSLLVDGVVGGINYIASPILIYYLNEKGIAWGLIIGYITGIVLASYLLSLTFQYDWSSLNVITVPSLIAAIILIAGQFILISWWSVPIYIAVSAALFLHLTFIRFRDDDWQQVTLILPAILKTAIEKIRHHYQKVATMV